MLRLSTNDVSCSLCLPMECFDPSFYQGSEIICLSTSEVSQSLCQGQNRKGHTYTSFRSFKQFNQNAFFADITARHLTIYLSTRTLTRL